MASDGARTFTWCLSAVGRNGARDWNKWTAWLPDMHIYARLLGRCNLVLQRSARGTDTDALVIVHVEQGLLNVGEAGHGVAVRAPQGLRDDLVHHAKADQVAGRDLQRLRGLSACTESRAWGGADATSRLACSVRAQRRRALHAVSPKSTRSLHMIVSASAACTARRCERVQQTHCMHMLRSRAAPACWHRLKAGPWM